MTEKEKEQFSKQFLKNLEQQKKDSDYNRFKKYLNLPIENWPDFNITWDKDPNKFYLALDSSNPEHFNSEYPYGVSLATVELNELDNNLNSRSQRTNNEIWKTGDQSVASCINTCVKGKKLTPPIIEIHENKLELVVNGGNHRLAVCRAKIVNIITILIPNDQKKVVSTILKTLTWI